MAKRKKIIPAPKLQRVTFPAPPKPPEPKIPDFYLNFRNDNYVATLRVPKSEMPKMAKLFFKIISDAGIQISKEETRRP